MMALVAKMIEGRGNMLASMSEGNSLTANMNIGGTFVEFDHTKLKNRGGGRRWQHPLWIRRVLP